MAGSVSTLTFFLVFKIFWGWGHFLRSHINLAMNICVSAIEIMIVIALYLWAALGDIAVIATILSLPGHELGSLYKYLSFLFILLVL